MQTHNIYALLVGIDNYPIPQHRLRGCVNDVKAFHQFLEGRCQSDYTELHTRLLLDQDATRNNIVSGFTEHLARATEGDVVVFYFSGHGAQEPAPEAFWYMEPDRLNQSIVCADSRTPEGGEGDLVDKELSYLIWEAGRKNAHVLIIMDCCHSGSGTRSTADEDGHQVRIRQIPVADRGRPVENYLGYEYFQRFGDELRVPKGNHILLAAARSREFAKETSFDGQQRGAFNYALLHVLQNAKGALSYEDLMTRVRAKVMGIVKEQHPQLEIIQAEAGQGISAKTSFMGGSVVPKQNYFTVLNKAGQWMLNAGAVHGIPKPLAIPTLLALYDESASEHELQSLANAIGEAEVIAVQPEQSEVVLRNVDNHSHGGIYKAKVKQVSTPPVLFLPEGDEEGLRFISDAYHDNPSVYYQFTTDRAQARYRLVAANNKYTIRPVDDNRPLAQSIHKYDFISAGYVLNDLETVARWEQTLGISNPDTSLPGTAAKLYLYEVWESDRNGNPISVNEVPLDTANGITLNYRLENGEWKEPEFLLRVVNHHDRELFCSMLYLSPSFGVSDEFLPTCLLPAGADAFPNDKKAVVVGVDEVLARAGVLESTFVLKLIYGTNEFSSSMYNQADLPFPQQDDFVTRSIRKKTPPADASDWATYELTITIVRPPDSVELNANTAARLPGITIQPHSGLNAEVSLISTAQVTRDLEGKVAVVPPVFDEINNISAYKFTDGHAADPGLSVLEITGVSDRSLINHQQPLVMQLDEELADDEMIIPFASDGEFFFPVGGTVKLAGGNYEVCIEELPEPSPAGTRSLGGSVKILFQKLRYNLIGSAFEYPILAQAVFNGDSEGSFSYNKSTSAIIDAVSRPETKNILLYIHGIIGDTEDMTKSAILARRNVGTQVKAIADHYDMVLTFDYENLNTKIEDNAILLRKRLEEIGLGEGHNKNLHIVAHSMGGLVSRWFIEREGGNAIVNHLIMLGTPNAGSPISNVKEWATMAISALLGKISLAVWGVSPLVYLFNKAMTVAGVALAQLKPDSDFLHLLNQSSAPGIPYSVISGNINQIQRDAMNRLFLKLENVKDRGLEFLFRADNDIAVSVPSIQYVPTNPDTHYIEVACDHMSYFSSSEGLAALSEVIFERVDFK